MQVGDIVIATFKLDAVTATSRGRKSYIGRLVRLTDNIAEVQGGAFEVRPFSRKLWDISLWSA